ncbi:hypothetical protein DAPPUDRAFT_315938 [Daphnia pulex]|uniref:DNA topoisomerase (ATP-hydrolyzing) n=1 Tax=Daphnia pulex TaxID=6669 RepID=E9GC34_DAPPU|nr:hypothetical protein DAPPUDRAFT_315938 [Daphnia pulex]|eukprot:EFX83212.1 hypothetical protein DAPPUDRAFT_315938 [Daphnia pulex]
MEYERSTPSLIDGLKLEQRKVLFTVLNRNDKDVNVARLALSVAEHTALHYEPGSLMRPIMWMAQDFVGSNNVSLLIPNGQFGTRHQGGKDAASPPLISTSISKLTRLIFHPQDDPLLTHRMDGDQSIEPEFYAPIIPLILVNGTSRIGMSYNPRDITENLKRMLDDDEEPIPMDPWFKGGLLKELISTTEMENVLQSPDPVQSIEN